MSSRRTPSRRVNGDPRRWNGMPTVDRFWTYVDKSAGDDGCWPWTAGTDKDGYGQFHYGPKGKQKAVRAHRFSLELATGTSGELAMHSCDNPPCCNPGHLSWATTIVNHADCIAKKRNAFGERAVQSKLTEADVIRIRARLLERIPLNTIARAEKVPRMTIRNIASGRSWKHLLPAITVIQTFCGRTGS